MLPASWGNFDRILLDEAGLGVAFGWPRAVPARWVDAMDLAHACNLPDRLDAAVRPPFAVTAHM
jgi:hypothetical protein